jgi:hypothetical protein
MVTRVQHIPAQFADELQSQEDGTIGIDQTGAAGPVSRVNEGPISFSVHDGQVRNVGVTRYVASIDGVQGGGVMQTLHRYGSKPSVEIEPGNPMSRTDVPTAIRLGILERDLAGNLREVGQHSAPTMQPLPSKSAPSSGQASQSPPTGQSDFSNPDEDRAFAATTITLVSGYPVQMRHRIVTR